MLLCYVFVSMKLCLCEEFTSPCLLLTEYRVSQTISLSLSLLFLFSQHCCTAKTSFPSHLSELLISLRSHFNCLSLSPSFSLNLLASLQIIGFSNDWEFIGHLPDSLTTLLPLHKEVHFTILKFGFSSLLAFPVNFPRCSSYCGLVISCTL